METTAQIIGINNRNLATFETALDVTEKLSEQGPDEIVLVGESEIRTAEDVARVQACGVDAVLVGEALMRGSKDLIEKLGPRDGKITGAKPRALLRHADFGASIFRPGRFCVTGISWHFESEADGLDSIPVHALSDQSFAHDPGPTFAKTAIVFGGAAFIGETGNNDFHRASLHETADLLNFSILGSTDYLTVVIKIDRLKLPPLHVPTEIGSALAPLGQRRSADIIAGDAGALPAPLLAATRETDNQCDDRE